MSEERTIVSGRDEYLGTVRVEMWAEGLVLWVGGRICWKAWEPSDAYSRLQRIAEIAEGSTTANSLPHIARIARGESE